MSEYISGTEAYKEYETQIKKATELSEANTTLISEFLTCGGINLDVLEFYGTHDIKKAEYIDPILPLVRNNAELEWYELVDYVIENKQGEISVVRWLEAAVDFFVENISCDIARQAIEEFDYIHKVADVKNRLVKEKAGEETESVYNVIKDVQMVLDAVEREETTKEENVRRLENQVLELRNEINLKNEKILELKNNDGEKVDKVKEELDYYKSSYEKQLNKNSALKVQYTEAQTEIYKIKKERDKLLKDIPQADNSSMEEILNKINSLGEEIKTLNNETKVTSDVPEKLLTFISSSLNNQKNEIEDILSEKLDSLLTAESISNSKVSSVNNEANEDLYENADNEEVVEEESDENSAVFEIEDEEIAVEEPKTNIKQVEKTAKSSKVETDKNTAVFDKEKKKGLISYFQEKKKARMVKNFLALKSESEQTSAILAQTLKRKFEKDTVKDIKAALKSKKVTPEFIYSIVIDENLTLDELNKVLVE